MHENAFAVRRVFATALLILILPALAPASEPRIISGSLIHRERIALSPETEMLLELRDPTGAVVTNSIEPVEGAQVPLPFTLEAPANVPLSLRAALRIDREIRWLSRPVEIASGEGRADLGEVMLRSHKPMGFASMLSCGELVAELGFVGHIARLRIGSTYRDLEPVPAASGSKFVSPDDAGTWVWTHGDVATLSLEGVELPECRLMLPEAH